MSQSVATAIVATRDDGLAASESFEINDAKSLPRTGHDKEIAKMVVIEETLEGLAASEDDVFTNAHGRGDPFEPCPVGPIANNDIAEIRPFPEQRWQSLDHAVDALVSGGSLKAPGAEDDGLTGLQAVLLQERGRFGGGKEDVAINGIGQEKELLRRDLLFSPDPVGGVSADGEKKVG